MVQENKEYQRDYFRAQNYFIFENIEKAIDSFCEMYPHYSREMAKEGIFDDTNCDWVVLNDGSVAAYQ